MWSRGLAEAADAVGTLWNLGMRVSERRNPLCRTERDRPMPLPRIPQWSGCDHEGATAPFARYEDAKIPQAQGRVSCPLVWE
jgi:hypothetical protein